MQKISYQRMKLLRNKNAKIIITNNIEAEALLDLTKKLDYALRILKENAGGLYDYEDVAKNINVIKELITHNSEFIEELYKKIGKDYSKPATIKFMENKESQWNR